MDKVQEDGKQSMLFLGIALDGTRLAAGRTGGMYHSFKVYDYFLKLPQFEVDHDGISSLSPRVLGWMSKLCLFSLYLLIMRGRKRYKYIFISGAWDCPLYLLFSKLRGSKIVVFWFHRLSCQPDLTAKDRYFWRLKELCQLRLADHSIINGKSTLRSLRELGFFGDDFVLAQPGLDKDIWVDNTSGYIASSQGFRILCTASLIPHKGIMDMLFAFSNFLNEIEDNDERSGVVLDIVGNDRLDPALTSELRKIIRERKLERHVYLRGRRNLQDLLLFFKRASLFVHPSHYEGWGMVVLEAASFGLPIIVSDGGSLPEVVNEGEYGLIFPVADHMALKEKIDLVYRDYKLRQSLSKKAAQLYSRSLTWDETGRLIENYLACKDEYNAKRGYGNG